MTGLKPYARDRELPALAGEPELCPPTEAQLVELVRECLATGQEPTPVEAELVFARWKPGTAITATYRVRLDDGRTEHVTYKRYRGEKARSIEQSYVPEEPLETDAPALAPFAVDAQAGWCLYTLPADRALPGLARALNLQRSARLLATSFAERLRWRRSNATLLRYKPEHRAVLRLDLALRAADESLVERRVALRVLPPLEAVRIAGARAQCLADDDGRADEIGTLVPRVLICEERSGLLFEEWLDVETFAGDDFTQAEHAGAALARLHKRRAPSGAATRPRSDCAELFAFDPELARASARLPAPPRARAATWVHGDFHPDQVARVRADGRFVLLDLDALRGGLPVEDLAAWSADAAASGVAHDETARELLAGYRRAGGSLPDARELAEWCAQELRERAAAALRRLEAGALNRARHLLERAREVAG
jgi:aminoglycoside phosphotransferase (APT) family kinase protein